MTSIIIAKMEQTLLSGPSEPMSGEEKKAPCSSPGLNENFGVIFHWGLYAVPAFDNVSRARARRIQNGSEWYLKRLTETGTYRPVSGWEETQEFHKKNYGAMTYQEFSGLFTCPEFDPDDWMNLLVSAGASYAILTARHHDGYCLWATGTTEFNSVKTGPKRDLLKEFMDAARKHGLKVGVYYSWTEFNRSCTKKYLDGLVIPQVKELQTYSPDIWWFDGDWACTTKYALGQIEGLCDWIHAKNPGALINDRLGGGKELKELRADLNYLGKADYRVYEDRAIPAAQPAVPWESVHTIGLSWGRNKEQQTKDYKTAKELKVVYDKVRAKGGKFLLNLGPNADGTLDEREAKILAQFGALL